MIRSSRRSGKRERWERPGAPARHLTRSSCAAGAKRHNGRTEDREPAMNHAEAVRSALAVLGESPSRAGTTAAESLTSPRLWEWRNLLHAARLSLALSPDDATGREIDDLLATTARLGHLLDQNADALSEIEAYRRARTLSAGSDVAGIVQERLDPDPAGLGTWLTDALAFFLNWRSNTVWVEVGERARRGVPREHLADLQDEVWGWARTRVRDNAPADFPQHIARSVEQITALIEDPEVPTALQVALIAQVYEAIVRGRIERILGRLGRPD